MSSASRGRACRSASRAPSAERATSACASNVIAGPPGDAMTAEVFVSIGSNVEPEHNLRWGLEQLSRRFGALRISPVYRNPPVGFEGDDFYNLVAAFDTSEPVRAVSVALDEMENRCGRDR